MRNLLFAVALLAGCEQKAAPPAPPVATERVTIDPQAAARLQMRLGANPTAVISSERASSPSVTNADPRRAVHATGFRANTLAPRVQQ
jgi:hypothetical protein